MIFDAITEAKSAGSEVLSEVLSEGLNEGLNEGLKLSQIDNVIMTLMEQDCYITNTQLAEQSGKSQSNIERGIKCLKDAGLIKRIGAKKTGYWQLNH